MIKIIEKIEGEAKLNFSFNQDTIDFVDIEFFSTRSIENILKNRPALDALVINPRVCGICNHAHLIATVQALEDCYEHIELSQKAKIIRELTLNFELIQSHVKWFYLTLYPLFGKKQEVLKAAYASNIMSKAIATFAGQYPHNSYAIVGGVISSPTALELIQVQNYIQSVINFFEENIVLADSSAFLTCNSIERLLETAGELPNLLNEIKDNNWEELAKSYDRFIVFGENSFFKRGKSLKTRLNHHISIDDVQEQSIENSFAKNVTFKEKFYEVGPLARAMVRKKALIKDAHRRYGDSLFSRVLARVCEAVQLLHHSKELLTCIQLDEPSYIEPKISIEELTGSGASAVEAARGSLIHKVELKDGLIQNYEMITPTQWNLGNGTKQNPGVAQKSMLGLKDTSLAELCFKSFDVCSVCTTH
ncbi:nickel-dependent hydrogenase large subunit [Sulfurimonas sp.]|uniref:nickel-dependent hydrogenase large subunit n=1 Tax=Sulfurimonas sp. TaxID=2022749 RepID=UPI003D112056